MITIVTAPDLKPTAGIENSITSIISEAGR